MTSSTVTPATAPTAIPAIAPLDRPVACEACEESEDADDGDETVEVGPEVVVDEELDVLGTDAGRTILPA